MKLKNIITGEFIVFVLKPRIRHSLHIPKILIATIKKKKKKKNYGKYEMDFIASEETNGLQKPSSVSLSIE